MVAVVLVLVVAGLAGCSESAEVPEPEEPAVVDTDGDGVPDASDDCASSEETDPVARLERLKGLLDSNAITQEEYDDQKRRILRNGL